MPRIGVTGHTRLSAATARMVDEALRAELRRYRASRLHGITCLAVGADQLFANAVLAVGGTFEAIVPAADYRDEVVSTANRPEFDELIRLAQTVTYMPFARSGPEAYMAASEELLRRSELLFAVWDGSTAGRLGETGAVVAAARVRNLLVRVLWPANAMRSTR
jgi:hypothetical protein